MASSTTLPLDLILVRHGESEGNVAQEFAKLGDDFLWSEEFRARHSSKYRLTEKGRHQAKLAGDWLKSRVASRFDVYYVSEFLRAQETAALMDLPGALWLTETYLRERDMGVFNGHSDVSRQQTFVEESRYAKSDTFYWAPPGGESMAQACIRVDRFLESLMETASGLRVVVVCHGNIMKCFRVRLEHMTQAMFCEWEATDKVRNGQIMWYSRRHPVTGVVGSKMEWATSSVPDDPSVADSPLQWRNIVRPRFTNDMLLSFLDSQVSPLITGTEPGLFERLEKLKLEKEEAAKAASTSQGD